MMKSIRRVAGWLAAREVWLVVAAAPFLLIPGRWTGAALALIALGLLCRLTDRGRLSVPPPLDAPLAYLLATAGVGLVVSVDLGPSLVGFWRLVLGVALTYALANSVRDGRGLRLWTLLLAAGGLGLVLLTLVATRWELARLASLPALYDRLPALLTDPEDGLGIHPRVMGMALATVLPVLAAVALAPGSRDRLLRGAAGFAALVMLVTVPFTQSPGALAGVAAALACLAVWRSRWFLLALFPLGGLAAWAALRVDLTAVALRLLAIKDTFGIAIVLRLDMWSRALAMIREQPFTGIGINSFPAIQTHFYPGYLLGPEVHAHNVFLQVALDQGLPGLLAFLTLLAAAGAMALRGLRRRPPADQDALIAGLAAGLLSYVIANQIDTLWQPKFGLLLWLLLGLLAAAYTVSGAGETCRGRLRLVPAWGLPVLLIGGALVLLPGLRERNIGAVLAQQALFDLRGGGQVADARLSSAAGHLRRAVDLGAGSSHAFGLLGSLEAWRGQNAAAAGTGATAASLDAFRQQVMLDLADPAADYMPFEALRRRVAGEPPRDARQDLLSVYGQWTARYPGRAEAYVGTAIIYAEHLGDPARAAATLRDAMARGAQPAAILQAALQQLGK